MHKFGWTYERTLSFVQSKRYCVSPSSVSKYSLLETSVGYICPGRWLLGGLWSDTAQFSIQLREYEPIVIAQKMMEQAGSDDGRLRENKRGMEDE